MYKTVVILPARSKSKRLPNKNLLEINKRSRTQHTQERRLYCTSMCPASDRRLGPEYGRVRETVDLDDLSQKSRIETEKKTTKCYR